MDGEGILPFGFFAFFFYARIRPCGWFLFVRSRDPWPLSLFLRLPKAWEQMRGQRVHLQIQGLPKTPQFKGHAFFENENEFLKPTTFRGSPSGIESGVGLGFDALKSGRHLWVSFLGDPEKEGFRYSFWFPQSHKQKGTKSKKMDELPICSHQGTGA